VSQVGGNWEKRNFKESIKDDLMYPNRKWRE